MLFFSSLLAAIPRYQPAAKSLFSALEEHGEDYALIENTKDIWVRDYMPVKTKSGNYISFRYAPGYLKDEPWLRTDFREAIAPQFAFSVTYSDINLDGGNVVFSPSREKVIISDRIFTENPEYDEKTLVSRLERLLEAEVILIPSLLSDMTGHADGMVRFVSENTVLCNDIPSKRGLEPKIKRVLKKRNIRVIDFPYFSSQGNSAIGCYLNFLETEQNVFLPIFGAPLDKRAISAAEQVFPKPIVPISIHAIAKDGGVLNCISWESVP